MVGETEDRGMEDLQIPRYLRTIAKRQRFNLSCQTLSDTGEIPRGDTRQRVLSSTFWGAPGDGEQEEKSGVSPFLNKLLGLIYPRGAGTKPWAVWTGGRDTYDSLV